MGPSQVPGRPHLTVAVGSSATWEQGYVYKQIHVYAGVTRSLDKDINDLTDGFDGWTAGPSMDDFDYVSSERGKLWLTKNQTFVEALERASKLKIINWSAGTL